MQKVIVNKKSFQCTDFLPNIKNKVRLSYGWTYRVTKCRII